MHSRKLSQQNILSEKEEKIIKGKVMINTLRVSKEEKELINRAFQAVLDNLQLDNWFDVDVTAVGRDTIRSLNLEHRGVDRVTDVLSFPNVEISWPICPCNYKNDIDPYTGRLFLGDIMVCRSKIKEQAKEYGHSEEREFCYLCVHGFLHLFGFDHIQKEDEEEMLQHQNEIMQALGILR